MIPLANKGEQIFAFHCRAMSLPEPIPQYPFAERMGRKFRADFAFIGHGLRCEGLLVEVAGGIFRRGGGAHSRPLKIQGDMERQQYAALLCYFMLPFTPQQVYSGFAVDWTKQTLIKLGWEPKEATCSTQATR